MSHPSAEGAPAITEKAMPSIFSRLKRYRTGDPRSQINPKENHATECLAASLRLSEEIRETFLSLVFGGEIPEKICVEDVEVDTQTTTQAGRPDLVCTDFEGRTVAAVEVKVESPLKREQLERYLKNIEGKNPDAVLCALTKLPPGLGLLPDRVRSITWGDLAAELDRNQASDFDKTSQTLCREFVHYLDEEDIVTLYRRDDLTNLMYWKRVEKACKATTRLLKMVGDQISLPPGVNTPRPKFDSDWPYLELKDLPLGAVATIFFCVPKDLDSPLEFQVQLGFRWVKSRDYSSNVEVIKRFLVLARERFTDRRPTFAFGHKGHTEEAQHDLSKWTPKHHEWVSVCIPISEDELTQGSTAIEYSKVAGRLATIYDEAIAFLWRYEELRGE